MKPTPLLGRLFAGRIQGQEIGIVGDGELLARRHEFARVHHRDGEHQHRQTKYRSQALMRSLLLHETQPSRSRLPAMSVEPVNNRLTLTNHALDYGFARSVPHQSAMNSAIVPVMRRTEAMLTHSSAPWMLREIGP